MVGRHKLMEGEQPPEPSLDAYLLTHSHHGAESFLRS